MNAPALRMSPPTVRRMRVAAHDGAPVDDWSARPTTMPDADAIDLWLIDLDADAVPRGDAAARSHARGAAARRGLRRLLCGALGCADDAIDLIVGARGKLALRAAGTPPLFFNASRSGALALVAIGRAEIGVDLEQISHRRARSDVDPVGALRRWTRHEAVAKAIGIGLVARFRPPPDAEWGSVQYGASFWGWRDVALPADIHAVAAVAYREREQRRCG